MPGACSTTCSTIPTSPPSFQTMSPAYPTTSPTSISVAPSRTAAAHGGVVTDHTLDHHAIVNQAHQAAEVALGHVDVHLPIITLILSCYREGRLLLNDKTEFDRSLCNIALDVAGTGGGAALGAKFGALVGTGLAPGVGTAVGGVLGALVGAIAGRLATNRIRRASLQAAGRGLQRCLRHAHQRTASSRRPTGSASSIRPRSERRKARWPRRRRPPSAASPTPLRPPALR